MLTRDFWLQGECAFTSPTPVTFFLLRSACLLVCLDLLFAHFLLVCNVDAVWGSVIWFGFLPRMSMIGQSACFDDSYETNNGISKFEYTSH